MMIEKDHFPRSHGIFRNRDSAIVVSVITLSMSYKFELHCIAVCIDNRHGYKGLRGGRSCCRGRCCWRCIEFQLLLHHLCVGTGKRAWSAVGYIADLNDLLPVNHLVAYVLDDTILADEEGLSTCEEELPEASPCRRLGRLTVNQTKRSLADVIGFPGRAVRVT